MRSWSVQIFMLNESGDNVPATVFERATYQLHPTFPNPVQGTSVLRSFSSPELWYLLGGP